jgi:Carboxypeptidase regulatory-like domain
MEVVMSLAVRVLATAWLVGLLLPAAAAAQARLTGADLSGTIADQTGAVLPGVIVTATNVDTNVARSATTDQRGRYTIAALPPGTYRIVAEMPGFVT